MLLEVLRNRLDAIADEMELTLLKSAASPIVKEGLDASAALFNAEGETIAQAAAIPIHLGALQFAAQRIVRAFPPETMREGDAFLLNDPYDGGTHLPDITSRCRCSPTAARWRWHARCAITRTWAAARRAACRPTPPSSTRRA